MSNLNIKNDTKITSDMGEVNVSTGQLAVHNKNDSNQVNAAVTNIDKINKNSNNIESGSGEAGEQIRNETFTNNPTAEVSEIRYFKDVGKSDSSENACSDKSLNANKKSLVTVHIEALNPVTSNSVSMTQMDSANNSNEFTPSIIKPPTYKDIKYGNVELYAPDTGPRIYNVRGNIISKPIITKNLSEAFRGQPIHGTAESKAGLKDFYEQKLRDYVGYGISDNEFARLQEFMDGDHLRTGLECTTPFAFPSQGPLSADLKSTPPENGPGQHLCVVKKLQLRIKKDTQNHYPRKLKYRGLRMLPLTSGDEDHNKGMPQSKSSDVDGEDDGPLEPGRDLIFRARIYRPHSYGLKDQKPTRHSVFNNDLVMLGRQRLTAFRDRMACANDIGMRIDVSDSPDCYSTECAKQIFPSGFLFINNVFYVDSRAGCADNSAVIRDWARRRRLGDFPVRDMAAVRLDEIVLRLGHPEVYMHQGKCEHLFTFSEVRLLGAAEGAGPGAAAGAWRAHFPCFTHISQNQSVYCTTCAEFGAKWVVVGCARVPFDPAFFCDTCFRFYLYDGDGNKIGDFKAYSYKGNTVNFMKPIVGKLGAGGDLSD